MGNSVQCLCSNCKFILSTLITYSTKRNRLLLQKLTSTYPNPSYDKYIYRVYQ